MDTVEEPANYGATGVIAADSNARRQANFTNDPSPICHDVRTKRTIRQLPAVDVHAKQQHSLPNRVLPPKPTIIAPC